MLVNAHSPIARFEIQVADDADLFWGIQLGLPQNSGHSSATGPKIPGLRYFNVAILLWNVIDSQNTEDFHWHITFGCDSGAPCPRL